MLAVTRLRPKRADWPSVVALYAKGSYEACLSGSHHARDVRETVLRARALVRLRRFRDALAELDRDVVDEKNAVRGEFASIRSLALAFLGRFDDASDAQRDARAYLFSVNVPALEVELHVNEAKLSFMKGDAITARRLAELAVGMKAGTTESRDSDLLTTGIARAEAGNLLCLIALANGDRPAAVRGFIESLRQLASSPLGDVGLHARILDNLSGNIYGVDVQLERSSFDLIRQSYETIDWVDDLATHRYHIVRELGLASALAGDHLSAFREYKTAFNVAPNRQLRLQALLDRVFLGRELHQTLIAHADLLEAQEMAKTIDWSQVEELELFCLPILAALLASIDLASARWALRAYDDRKARSTRTSSLFTDKRFHGDYLTAVAAIARAEQRINDADRALIEAFEIFDNLNIRWRAAQVAFDLQETDDRFKKYARDEARRRPNSWLASKVASVTA